MSAVDPATDEATAALGAGAGLVVVRAVGLVTVQDLGRRGYMHVAVPPGGALVSELLAVANRGAGNPDDAAGIELLGQLVVRALADVLIASDRDGARELRAGEELAIASGERRCTYLAIRGGVDAPVVLGGRGTLLCAELGRPLRAGDVIAPAMLAPVNAPTMLAPAHAPTMRARAPAKLMQAMADSAARFTEAKGIAVIPGPDLDAFGSDVLERLVAAPYRVLPSSDRVGTRLAGAALARAAGYCERSRPMVIGALEVPADGQPIVLGPEHPTTGGYPIVAVIATAELGRFFAIRLGGDVQFALRA